MRYGFGVDIFGTEIKMGFFSESGELIEKWKIVTPLMQDGNRILPAIADDIERYMKEHHLYEDQIIGVGVGIPGPVNGSGVVNKCVNFGWGVFNIDRALSGLTGLPVKSGNIANLSALESDDEDVCGRLQWLTEYFEVLAEDKFLHWKE